MTKPDHPDVREFHVETRYQTMARRKGGVPRDQAIKQAEQQIELLKPQFDDWLDGELQEFAALIKTAEAGAAEAGWIAGANRRSHDLRDCASTLGFELLAFIANSLCEILDAIEAGRPCNIDSIACHLDALTLARQGNYRYMKPEQVPELTEGLDKVVKRIVV
jgi:hypothetical protein